MSNQRILVTGYVTARPETFDEVLKLSQEHVERSRKEEGCISHAVHRDVENPNRLVFVETWASRETLAAHFALSHSREFIEAIVPLSGEPPSLAVYEATDISSQMTSEG